MIVSIEVIQVRGDHFVKTPPLAGAFSLRRLGSFVVGKQIPYILSLSIHSLYNIE